jgi:hypothetical protein
VSSAARTLGGALRCTLVCVVLAAGCSSGDDNGRPPADSGSAERSGAGSERDRDRTAARPTDIPPPDGRRPSDAARPSPPARASCPAAAANCRSASGRVLYVERVDPDGDGDAHFVLSSPDSITGPGISVIDVKRSLRPSPLPGPGDLLSAAGPVYRGSYGQRQIEAIELNVARAR